MEKTVGEIAALVQGSVEGDSGRRVRGVMPFDEAGAEDVTCAAGAKYIKRLKDSCAGAILVPETTSCAGKTLIRTANPYLAFAQVISLFHAPPESQPVFTPRPS